MTGFQHRVGRSKLDNFVDVKYFTSTRYSYAKGEKTPTINTLVLLESKIKHWKKITILT